MLAFAPDRLQLDPAGGHINRAEGEEEEPRRARPAMRDQIDFAVAGGRLISLGERPNGDLLLEPRPWPGGGRPARRVAGSGRRQQPGEGGPAGLPDELVDGGAEVEFLAPEEPVEQLRNERVEAVGADAPAGLPKDFGGGGAVGAVLPDRPVRERVAGARGARRSRRMAALRWRPVTVTISSKSWCFWRRLACWYRSRWTAVYSRKLALVTVASSDGLVTVTSDLRGRPG